MLRIKWERIALIIFGSFFMYCIVSHIVRNGFDINILYFEVILYGLVLTINYIAIGNTRKLFLKK